MPVTGCNALGYDRSLPGCGGWGRAFRVRNGVLVVSTGVPRPIGMVGRFLPLP